MLWLQYKTRWSHSPHISCVTNGSASVQWSVGQLPSLRQNTYNTLPVRSHFTSDCTLRQTTYNSGSLPLYLRLHRTPDKLPTTLAQIAPTLPQTAQYIKLPTTLALSHFTSDCTVRQTNYLQHWLRSLPLYLRLHTTPDKLPTTLAKITPTLPQTAHYTRQTTYNTGSVRSHFTSDCTAHQTTYNTGSGLSHFTSECTVRQTNYLQHWLRSLPLYLRLHTTPDKLPTTPAQITPTLPQTAHYARQTTYNTGSDYSHLTSDCTLCQTAYNTGSVCSHFTPDCTIRQTNYLQHWLSSLPLYLRLYSMPDKLPTTLAQFAPTLPLTAQYASRYKCSLL